MKKILKELPEGAVLCLQPGVYNTRLWIDRSLTVRGLGGGVILDGNGQASTIEVVREAVDFVLEQVTVRGGAGGGMGQGGNLNIDDSHRVVLREVTLESGSSDDNGGGGLLLNRGELLMERCRVTQNRGSRAQAILVNAGAKLTLRDCLVAGNGAGSRGDAPAIFLTGAVDLTVERSTIFGNRGMALRVGGDDKIPSTVSVSSSILGDPAIVAGPAQRTHARIVVKDCALSAAVAGIEDAGGNVVGEIRLDAEYRPIAGSIAVGKGPGASGCGWRW